MTHIVIHDDSNNVTHYAEFDDLQAAATHLEELVNENGDTTARLYALEPVEFALKSYVRIEIGGSETTTAANAPEVRDAVDEQIVEDDLADVFTDEVEENRVEENRVEENRVEENRVEENRVEENRVEDEMVKYVDASLSPVDPFAPDDADKRPRDESPAGDSRRGLFGR